MVTEVKIYSDSFIDLQVFSAKEVLRLKIDKKESKMISAKQVIEQFHSHKRGKDIDLIIIEERILSQALENKRELFYVVKTQKYSQIMNTLLENGYNVNIKTLNKEETELKINW